VLKGLILKNRSYRRFSNKGRITERLLRELIGYARLCPSAANLQPLRFILSWTQERNNLIFPRLRWAGYLADWDGPSEEERPTGYIIILGDTSISKDFGLDCGIVAQTILLGVVEKGFGGCMIGSLDRKGLREILHIPDKYQILLVIALGKPVETVVIEDMKEDGDIRYWRDKDGVHHVPKRSVEDLIIEY